MSAFLHLAHCIMHLKITTEGAANAEEGAANAELHTQFCHHHLRSRQTY
jgi:hypothetical protein